MRHCGVNSGSLPDNNPNMILRPLLLGTTLLHACPPFAADIPGGGGSPAIPLGRKHPRHHASSLKYLPLTLLMNSHPFFGQTWHARHILDHNSPLVRGRIRKIVKVKDGKWPRYIFGYGEGAYSSLSEPHPFRKLSI